MRPLTLYWLRITKKNPTVFLMAFIILIALFMFLAKTRLQFEENMLSSLPESIKLELLKKISERQKSDQLVGVKYIGTEDETNYALGFVDSCLKTSPFLDSTYGHELDVTSVVTPLLSNPSMYLLPVDYDSIRSQLGVNGRTKTLQELMNKLYSPESIMTSSILFKDPFSTLEKSTKSIFSELGGSSLISSFKRLSDDGIQLYHLNFSANDIEKGREFEAYLNNCFDHCNVQVRPLHFGYYQIPLANAEQIRTDTRLTMGVAGILVLLLLLYYYRKLSVLVLFGLPVVFAFTMALTAFVILGRPISAISLGMGAVVIGIILDFNFHFYTHYRSSNSLEETIRSISNPLALGALTTIFAFGALYFTNSKAMQDFGLFASFSILGAALFTLFILPTFIQKFRIKYKKDVKPFQWKIPVFGRKIRLFVVVSIIGSTVVMGYFASKVSFNSDLNSINYFPQELRNNEAQVIGIDSRKQHSVFAFASGKNEDEARENNLIVRHYLDSVHSVDTGFKYVSTAILLPSKKKIEESFLRWNDFWETNAAELTAFDSVSATMGFRENAFSEFKAMTKAVPNYNMIDTLAGVIPIDFSFYKDSCYQIASLIEYPLDKYEHYLQPLDDLPNVDIVSRKGLAIDLVNALEADFNYILFISIFIVAVALLLVYGRIELMLITFLPMAISWIWILGFSHLFGIEFNFINIVVCTFVFGLGDDFAIFITDGHLQEFREGRKELPAFKSAIFLSALSTIIGCGSLLFAKHPALNSIAPMAILGMIVILVSSFVLQPWLFEVLISGRAKKNKPTLGVFSMFCSTFAFSYFFIGCTFLLAVLGVFILLPFKKRPKVSCYNWVISKFARSLIYVMINVKKTVVGKENLPTKPPSIIIANHQSFIDILAIVMLSPKVKLLTNDWVYNSILFGWAIRYAGYITASHGNETNVKAIKEMLDEGYSLAIFPEGTRSKDGKIGRFHKGAFMLSQELNIPITPVLLHGFHFTMSKHDYMLKNGSITIKVLPPILPTDKSFGESYQHRTKAVAQYFKTEMALLSEELENTKYFYQRVKANYNYRGPLVESYFKVKWRFERKHFDIYSQFIHNDDHLLDAGCGYGYFSFFLHYKFPELRIDAMDMDEDKIAYASNNTDKSSLLNFFSGNIKDVDYTAYNKIFFNDVLHYLSERDLNDFIDNLFCSLKPFQTIFIRDGNEDEIERHKTTRLTEIFSTFTGFNKTENKLFFFGKKWLENKAKENKLVLEIIEQDTRTSNVMYIIKWPK